MIKVVIQTYGQSDIEFLLKF